MPAMPPKMIARKTADSFQLCHHLLCQQLTKSDSSAREIDPNLSSSIDMAHTPLYQLRVLLSIGAFVLTVNLSSFSDSFSFKGAFVFKDLLCKDVGACLELVDLTP